MKFLKTIPYIRLWCIFGYNPEAGLSVRDANKKRTIYDIHYRKDGLDFNKPYARFRENLDFRSWKHRKNRIKERILNKKLSALRSLNPNKG